jgi:sigma-B regulation protein RsbU (phosphoserine phosphatase)
MVSDSLKFLKDEAARLTQENHDLREELGGLRHSARALSSLYYFSQQITPQVDVRQLLGNILDSALAGLNARDGSLMLVDEENGDLVFTIVRGEAAGRLEGYHLPKGVGIAGWVAEHRQPQAVHDVRRDPRFYAQVDEAFGFNTRSMVCVPVYLDDGRLLGVIEVLNKVSDKEFTQDDMDLLLIVSQLAATAMRRAERAIETAEREKRRAALLNTGQSK